MSNIPDFTIFQQALGAVGMTEDNNLFDVVHLSENDHTNILCSILNYQENGEKIFLSYFLKEFLDYKNELSTDCTVKVQVQANSIAKSKEAENKGIIDLQINNGKDVIILESKACDAVDGDRQLERYFETYEEKQIKRDNIWIIYLTRDGSKELDTSSLGKLNTDEYAKWRDAHLVYINYADDVLPWLKDSVLPNVRYLESGTMIQGLLLYIKYLEGPYLLSSNDKDSLFGKKSIEKLFEQCEVHDLYDTLKAGYKVREKEEKFKNDTSYSVYLNCIRYFINKKVNAAFSKIPELSEWRFNFTAGFIQLMKIGWSDANSGIHFEYSGYGNKNPQFNWALHFESGPKYQDYCEISNDILQRLKTTTESDVTVKLTPSHHYLFFNNIIIFEGCIQESTEKCLLNNTMDIIVRYFKNFVSDQKIKGVIDVIEGVISQQ